MSENKDIVPWVTKDDIIIPRSFSGSMKNYLLDRIAELEKKNEELSRAVNDQRVNYLKKFLDLMSIRCAILGYKITILQCASKLERRECIGSNNCQERNALLKKLMIK